MLKSTLEEVVKGDCIDIFLSSSCLVVVKILLVARQVLCCLGLCFFFFFRGLCRLMSSFVAIGLTWDNQSGCLCCLVALPCLVLGGSHYL